MIKSYSKKYFKTISSNLNKLSDKEFLKFIHLLENVKKNNTKVIFIGNGGSAAMASHSSVDFTKTCKIRAINFNEADLITCFANDYGYENWVKEALKSYARKDDLVIAISSSGQSKNIHNAVKYCKRNN